MQRTKEDIYALINKGETFHLECKKAQGGLPSSIWESYSAFCNTDGGVILLGVKEFEDKHFEVVGVNDAAKLVQDFTNTLNDNNKGLQKMFQFLGYSEKAGSGFPKIFMGTDEQHWARPSLQEDFKYDQTTLTLPTVDLTEEASNPHDVGKHPENSQKSTLKTLLKSTLKIALNPTDSKIVESINGNPKITITELQKVVGLTRDGVNKSVRRLKSAGVIRRVGPDKGGHWEILTPKGGDGE